MEKTCKTCGSKFEGAINSRYCSITCSDKAFRMKYYYEGLSKYKDYKECPLLSQCEKASGINCSNRDFRVCSLFLNLLIEKKARAKNEEVLA